MASDINLAYNMRDCCSMVKYSANTMILAYHASTETTYGPVGYASTFS